MNNLNFVVLVIWLALSSCVIASTAKPMTELSFNNFGKRITLYQSDRKALQYKYIDNRLVQISNRVIVKTPPQVSAQNIQSLNQHIEAVRTLFSSKYFTYYQLNLAPAADLGAVIAELSKHTTILLAQPDLLQFRKPHNQKTYSANYEKYLHKIKVAHIENNNDGKGITIAIIDNGFSLLAPEFQQLDIVFHYDLDTFTHKDRGDVAELNHGTQVASIVFSQQQPSQLPPTRGGSVLNGLAPAASLIALTHRDTWLSKTLLSFQLAKLNDADIINCSWSSPWLLEPIYDAVTALTNEGREGKGSLVVFSAGNEGKQLKTGDSEATIPAAFAVGAVDVKGNKLPISNYGDAVNAFSYGGIAQTVGIHDKTSKFSGTSLAAAIVSGLAARILSKDKTLTVSELKNIVANELAKDYEEGFPQ